MKYFFQILLVFAGFMIFHSGILAQESNYPGLRVGQSLPSFQLNHVTHYTKPYLNNEELMGKWVVLDFWFTGCLSCITSFPKINKLQQHYQDRIQFMMVGQNDQKYNAHVESVFEGLRKKMNLTLAAAYDSVVFKEWNIRSMPYVLIINPSGIIASISEGSDLTTNKLDSLLAGQRVIFFNQMDLYRDFEKRQEKLAGQYEGIVSFSAISTWQVGDHPWIFSSMQTEADKHDQFNIHVNKMDLKQLYRYAFTGYPYFSNSSPDTNAKHLYETFYPLPILEMKDTSTFAGDYITGKNHFNYRLRLANRKLDSMMLLKYMQQDMERYFKYQAGIETRKVKVWKIIAGANAGVKLRAKEGNDQRLKIDPTGLNAVNLPVNRLPQLIGYYLSLAPIPCFDETGIVGNIDIHIDALMTDLAQVKEALKRYDLDLVYEDRLMKVIVIHDID